MKPIGDGSFKRELLSESDLSAYFEKLLNELDEFGEGDARPDSAHGNVRLSCNRELVDVASIELAVVRISWSGAEMIEFVCPRCDELHESPRFGGAVSAMDKQ